MDIGMYMLLFWFMVFFLLLSLLCSPIIISDRRLWSWTVMICLVVLWNLILLEKGGHIPRTAGIFDLFHQCTSCSTCSNSGISWNSFCPCCQIIIAKRPTTHSKREEEARPILLMCEVLINLLGWMRYCCVGTSTVVLEYIFYTSAFYQS